MRLFIVDLYILLLSCVIVIFLIGVVGKVFLN